ncbi:LysR family transcriptional regulator [Sphingomonas sp. GB1N7]|uniref:LysR family transcriptional regulator n=1 Tax=Parasphingomonas caseinilytica TaxID=3096158 RepID=UPI002FC9AC3E
MEKTNSPDALGSSHQRHDGERSPFLLDNLALLRAFVAVVELKSFTAAGRRLNVVPSTVSKHIAALEQQLSCQLVARSTKTLSITELGTRFYKRCQSILHEVDEAEIEVGEYKSEPQGLLRVSAPTTLATHVLAPVFFRFKQRFPKVMLDLTLTPASQDLVGSGTDVAIRISSGLDPSLIALKLAPNMRLYCASPEYLERRGTPATPVDLHRHDCVVVKSIQQSASWPFRMVDGRTEHVVVSGGVSADNIEMIARAVVAGLGVGHLSRFLIEEHIARGELVELFPETRVVESNIYAVYPERRNLALKTRAFIDHLRSEFREPPAWAK